MRDLVRKEMEAGALELALRSFIPPRVYAKTEELIELCKVAQNIRADTSRICERRQPIARSTRRIKFGSVGRRTSRQSLPHQGLRPRKLAKRGPCSLTSSRRKRKGWKLPPTCTPTPRQERDSTRVCHHGRKNGGYPALFKRPAPIGDTREIKAEVQKPTDSWRLIWTPVARSTFCLPAFKSEKLKPLTGKTLADSREDAWKIQFDR